MSESESVGLNREDRVPLVSAIISTVGRPSLVGAVESALGQSWKNLEVIVSVDGSRDLLDHLCLPNNPRLRIVASDVHIGGQMARGRAIAESSGEFVAILDDDDTWLPTKIENQVNIALQLIESGSKHVLVACRSAVVKPDGQIVRITARRLPSPRESIPEYLFVRRRIIPGETAIGSSMLLFDRELAEIVPLDSNIPMHDDWDWLLAVQLRTGTRVEFSPKILLRYADNPAGASVSSSGNWLSSSDWFLRQKKNLSAREFGDAVLCICAPLALQQGEWRAVGKLVRISIRQGSPGFSAFAFVFLMCAKSLFRNGSKPHGRRWGKDCSAERQPLGLQDSLGPFEGSVSFGPHEQFQDRE